MARTQEQQEPSDRAASFEDAIPFEDRCEAGRVLAGRLLAYRGRADVIVLGLARGGMPVAAEVAAALDAPLDVFVVRKLGAPGSEELAIGAIATGGEVVLNQPIIRALGLGVGDIDAVRRREERELARRERAYRADRPPLDVRGRVVILVDDGLATGATMRAAVQALRALAPERVVVAAPVGSREACRSFGALADAVVCARMPEPFMAVGIWYQRFDQTTDEEVRRLLATRQPATRRPENNEWTIR